MSCAVSTNSQVTSLTEIILAASNAIALLSARFQYVCPYQSPGLLAVALLDYNANHMAQSIESALVRKRSFVR